VLIVVSEEIRAAPDELEGLIRRAFDGIDTAGVEVRVERARRSSESFCGRAYPEPPKRPPAHPDTRYVVRLTLPSVLRNRGYPKSYRYARRTTAPWITVGDWRERLVALAAHEAFHVQQFRQGLRRSEVQAERWALTILTAWTGRAAAPERRGGREDRPVQLSLLVSIPAFP
jgi:hypothetical protein